MNTLPVLVRRLSAEYWAARSLHQYKYVTHCTFIIHKNGNKTGIQPILKSNSTSLMFNNIFCEMKGKKVIHWEGPGGMGEKVKSTMARSLPVENLLPQNVGSIINYLQ